MSVRREKERSAASARTTCLLYSMSALDRDESLLSWTSSMLYHESSSTLPMSLRNEKGEKTLDEFEFHNVAYRTSRMNRSGKIVARAYSFSQSKKCIVLWHREEREREINVLQVGIYTDLCISIDKKNGKYLGFIFLKNKENRSQQSTRKPIITQTHTRHWERERDQTALFLLFAVFCFLDGIEREEKKPTNTVMQLVSKLSGKG